MQLTKLFLVLAMTTTAYPAVIFYSNTTVDALDSAFFSASGVTEIGDQLKLPSTAMLTSLDAQFYNAGADATFDAVLRFYNAGSPVGTQIGGLFVVTNISIASGTSGTVTFPALDNLLVPEDLVVTFSVENVSAGGDIGLNFFDPPAIGTSSPSFFVVYDGTDFAQASTLLDHDNLYMQISGTAAITVPEPSTAATMLGALLVMAYGRYRCLRTSAWRSRLRSVLDASL